MLENELVHYLNHKNKIQICLEEVMEKKNINNKLDFRELMDTIPSEEYETKTPVINHSNSDPQEIFESEVNKEYVFEKILETNSKGIVITDTNGKIQWVNTAFSESKGYCFKELIGKKTSVLKSGFNSKEFYEDMWNQLIIKGQWSGQIWNRNKAGEIYLEWLKINSIKDHQNNTTHYVGIFKDLAKKRKLDLRINELRQKDSLTGLYNRNHFLQVVNYYIEKSPEKNKKFAILLIDIKDFKEINNSLGHLIGDKLLANISRKLLELSRENHIVSRFGDDEFIILYKSPKSEKEIRDFGEKLLNNLNKEIRIENTILHIEANIGVSMYPKDSLKAEELVRFSNIAMHDAKKELSNNIVFYLSHMSKEIDEKFLLVNQLVDALSNKELYLCFQPIFDVTQPKRIVCVEALVRWKNPILGLVSPDKFIPIAEKTGQIIFIGQWILEQVCNQINTWKSKGFNTIPVSVNMSVKQLKQQNFAQGVIDTLNKHSINPNNIELEITESVSSGDTYTIINNLNILKEYGIKIAMDDFGTGFSSLGQLEVFGLNKLKIDKVFLDDIEIMPKKQKLVKAIIAMAKGLELIVVAEGIETIEQLDYLRELQCELGQGYLVSKPLLADELELILDKASSKNK